MKWLYYIRREWIYDYWGPVQFLFLRPVKYNEKGEKLVGKIIDLQVLSMTYFQQDQFRETYEEQGLKAIYEEHMRGKLHHVEEEIPKEDTIYLLQTKLYLIEPLLTEDVILKWVERYFEERQAPFEGFEKTDFDDFCDTNSLLNALTEGVKRMEPVWGKEWWRRDKEEQ